MENVAVKFDHVKKYFVKRQGLFGKASLKAVDDVSFEIRKGEILAVVGESGCGKSTMAKMLCKVYEPTEGSISVNGMDVTGHTGKKDVSRFRKEVQMIFQDPFGSLNPAHKAGRIVGRAVELHYPELSTAQVRERVVELFETVGLTPAADFMEKHPNQLSGGQRQRIVIARALAVKPSILVADEPTSMLDVSIGIDIMNLMLDLQKKEGLTYLYITHNLASARYMANRMVVMYAGNCVEQGGTDDIIQSPLHPYTVLLLSSTPEPFREEKLEIHASEDLPDLAGDMKQCPFASRCPRATDRCRKEKPENYVIGDRQVKCFLYEHAKEGDGPLVDVSIYR
ncbi:ABC transporter ATP-binding protein [Neglecta sp. X4]|uniref:ABC transporter ATP-binding protein n=1 Tax=unclassified Neglectibacter TaxID=2632164 RepID=UPI00136D690E|nr:MULTISPECIES: ABC transporter ATP-binding protein [unclassified Neglectibacter]NBI17782.1 ABC transporter ATP-binding protein [Neglectibacter sp. 59]NBJ73314.1 ABC transporter ATP-binding protein [Neglectibacter sp. X4]NCE81234.1 ABC transporter ATP-binding protein [Neglectibacter sp. X58]